MPDDTVAKLKVRIRELERKLAEQESLIPEAHGIAILKDFFNHTLTDVVYQLDPDGVIVWFGDTVEAYGYTPQELTGRNILDIIHPDDHERVINNLKERRAGMSGTRSIEIRVFTKAQEIRVFEVRSYEAPENSVYVQSSGKKRETGAPDAGGIIGIIGVARDITEQKQAEEHQRRTASLLASLNTTKDQFIAEGDTGDAFQSLLHTLISMTGSEYGFLDEVFVDERGDTYKLSLALSDISWDDESQALYRELAARNLEFRKLDNFAGIPATTGKTVISNDPAHDTRSGGLPHGHPSLHSYMGLPLYFRGVLVGVAGVANRPGGYTDELAEWLQPFLSTCAAFIKSVRSQEKERRYVADIQSVNDMTLATLNASDESAFLIDTNGIVLSGNKIFAERLGTTPDEIIGKNIFDLLPSEVAKARKAKVEDVTSTGKPLHFEDIRCGHVFSHSLHPICDESGAVRKIAIFAADITEQKNAEHILRESELRYHTVADFTYDWEQWNDPDGAILYVSPSFERMTGYTVAEYMDNPSLLRSIVHPDDYGKLLCMNGENLPQDIGNYAEDIRITHRDGSARWINHVCLSVFDRNGAYIGRRSSNRDITDRVRAELELKENEERCRMILKVAMHGFWITDMRGRLLEVNDAYCRMSGYSEEELLCMAVTDLESIETAEEINAHIQKLVITGEDQFESRHRRKGGSLFDVEISIQYKSAEGGRMVAFIKDITEEKLAENKKLITDRVREKIRDMKTAEDIKAVVAAVHKSLDELGVDFHGFGINLLDPSDNPPAVVTHEIAHKGGKLSDAVGIEGERLIIDIWRTGKTVYRNNLGNNDRHEESGYLKKHYKAAILSVVDVPFSHGTLAINSPKANAFSPGDIELLEEMAGILSEGFRRYDDLKELERQRKINQVIIDKAHTQLVYLDTDFNFVAVNKPYADGCRCAPEELVGKNHFQLFPHDENEAIFRRVRDTGQAVSFHDKPFEFPDQPERGITYWDWTLSPDIDHAGNVKGLVFSLTETTVRKQAEEALRQSELNYQQVVNTMFETLTVIDGDGGIHFANEKAARNLSGSPDTVMTGRNIREFVPEQQSVELLKKYRSVIDSNETLRQEVMVTVADGDTWFLNTLQPILFGKYKIPSVLSMSLDITDRKKAEQSLRESEKRYRLIVEKTVDLVYRYEFLPLRRFAFVSPSATEMTGYTPEEHYADPDLGFKLIHPDDRHVFEQLGQSEESIRKPLVLRWRKKNGDVIWTEQINVPIYDAEGRLAALEGIARDITDRKNAEEELRSSEERLQERNAFIETILDNLPIGLSVNNTIDGNTMYINREFQAIYGWPAEDMTSVEEFFKHVYPDRSYREELVARVMGDILSGDPQKMIWNDIRITRKDGSTGYINARNIPIPDQYLMISTVQDVTELKRADEARLESEEKFRSLMEGAPDAIFVQTDLRFAYVNQAACRMFGAETSEQLLGQPVMDRFHPDYHESVNERIRSLNAGKMRVAPLTQIYLRLDGSEVNVETSAVPVVYDGKNGALVFVRDITERIQAEEEKEKLQSQLLQAQKMESVGRLAGGVAHDFNNMLGVILGYTEMSLEDMKPESPLYANLQEIRKATKRSSDLTRQLLAFARKQTIKPIVLNLNEAIEGMLKMLRRLIGEDIDLAWIPDGNLSHVKIDPSQIDQILANLCVNARDAIDGVGNITIETGNAVFDEDYCGDHPGFIPGEYVMLAVSDNGCGMDKDMIVHIFEPFFTTKGMGEGTGLGLATVYGIVKQNNGFINVYSELGEGTTFRMYFPRYVGKTALEWKKAQEQSSLRGRETILIVEDEDALLQLGRHMLESLGYHVLTAGTPGEAMRTAEQYSDIIHLLITDVVMPEMNGRNLAKLLLSLYPRLKCMFMSGYTANVIAHHGVLDEGVHFIQKPYTLKELSQKVREALNDQ